MDNKALWIMVALLALAGGYGACALSTSDEVTESLAGDRFAPLDPRPRMSELRSDAGPPIVMPTAPVEPTAPTMPQAGTVFACGGTCATGEVCCPNTHDCVPADCAMCCAPDLTHPPAIAVELAPRGEGPAGPMPAPDVVEGGSGPRPPSPDPRIGE